MKRALRIVGIVVAVILVAVIALPFGLNVNRFRPQLEAELSSALGRKVTVGNLSLSLFAGRVSAKDLAIADDPSFSQEPFVRAQSLKVGVELLPLIFSRSLRITNLTLDEPQIVLRRSTAGAWNFSSLGGSSDSTVPPAPAGGSGSESSTANLAIKKLNVNDGRITIMRGDTGKTHVYDNVNIAVRNFSFNAQFPFSLSAGLPNRGTLKIEGNAGPISSLDASLTPLQAQVSVKNLDLAASGIGELSPGIAGIADFDGGLSSDGRELRTSGALRARQLKLVQSGAPAGRPVELKYALEHELHTQAGTLTEGDIAMGNAVAHLTGSYQMHGDSALLNMKLNAQGMPVNDLEAMLPALGVVLPSGSRLQGGTLSADLTVTGPASGPVIAGPIRLSNSQLAGFSLGSKLSAVSKLSGGNNNGTDTSIQNLSAEARIAPDGVRTDKVNLTIPALGVLTGSGSISPGGSLDYKMTASLNGAVATAVTKLAGLGDKSETIPFFIRGTTSNPSFVPDVKGMLSGQIGSQIGNALKSKLASKAQSKGLEPAALKASQKKPSVFSKITGFFHHKKKKDQAPADAIKR
jgi:AsmA protein